MRNISLADPDKYHKFRSPCSTEFWENVATRQVKYLFGISQTHIRLNLPQTIRDPKNAIDQCPISRAFDLEVPEQSVRAEKCDGLI